MDTIDDYQESKASCVCKYSAKRTLHLRSAKLVYCYMLTLRHLSGNRLREYNDKHLNYKQTHVQNLYLPTYMSKALYIHSLHVCY